VAYVFSPKREIQNSKFEREGIFADFHSPQVRKNKFKYRTINILGFHCVAKNIEG
jgi:hypothetical protein